MSQISFSDTEYNLKKRKTRREKFLEKMGWLTPWRRLEKVVPRYILNPVREEDLANFQ